MPLAPLDRLAPQGIQALLAIPVNLAIPVDKANLETTDLMDLKEL